MGVRPRILKIWRLRNLSFYFSLFESNTTKYLKNRFSILIFTLIALFLSGGNQATLLEESFLENTEEVAGTRVESVAHIPTPVRKNKVQSKPRVSVFVFSHTLEFCPSNIRASIPLYVRHSSFLI